MHEIYWYARAIHEFDLKDKYSDDNCDDVKISVHVKKGNWILFKGYLGDYTFEPIAIADPEDSSKIYKYQYTNEDDEILSDESAVLNPKISLLWNRRMEVPIPRGNIDIDNISIFDGSHQIDDVFYGLTWDMYEFRDHKE